MCRSGGYECNTKVVQEMDIVNKYIGMKEPIELVFRKEREGEREGERESLAIKP